VCAAFADLPKEFGRQQQVKKRRDVDEACTEASARGQDEDDEDERRPPPNVFARPVDVPSRSSGAHQEEDGEEEGGGAGGGVAGGEAEAAEGAEGRIEQQDGPAYEQMSARRRSCLTSVWKLVRPFFAKFLLFWPFF